MREARHVRAVIAGLLGFASAEEEMLLTAADSGGVGGPERGGPERWGGPEGPERWGAVPLLAHITEFKAQQSERIEAILSGRTPPAFADIDHASAAVYAAYASRAASDVVAGSRRVTAGLCDGVRLLADEDLLDPARHSWLRGRPLWLQVIVRGFWHPTGHIADYYLRHGQPDRAVALQSHAVATASYLDAPPSAAGMASYGLACAQAQAGLADAAAAALASALALNPDVRVNAARDPDLDVLRLDGRLDAILAAAGGAGGGAAGAGAAGAGAAGAGAAGAGGV
jgi:hypothetical protein